MCTEIEMFKKKEKNNNGIDTQRFSMPYFPQRKYETNVASKHPSPQTFPTPRKKTIDQKGSRYTAPRRRSNRVIHRPMVQRRVSFYTLLPSPPFLERGQRAGVTLAWDATRSLNGVPPCVRTHTRTPRPFEFLPVLFQGGREEKRPIHPGLKRTSTVNEDPVFALNLHLTEPRYYWKGLRAFVIGPFPWILRAGDITSE